MPQAKLATIAPSVSSIQIASFATEVSRDQCPAGFLDICALLCHDARQLQFQYSNGTPIAAEEIVLPREPCQLARQNLLLPSATKGFHGTAHTYIAGIQAFR